MRFAELDIKYYNFYKSPDGEDCLEKTYYFTKYAGISGAVFSFYETILFSKPSTLTGVLVRFGRFTLPFAGMGFVFGSSLCLLGQIRKTSDVPNYAIAGALAGSVWGFKYNSVSIGHTWAVFFGLLAGYIKFFHYYDISILNKEPEYKHRDRGLLNFRVKMFDDPGRPNEA